jgi:glycosyltransferase involved in cell wall biosynthesis
VAAHLDAALTVYYCVDDFAAFPGIDPGMIARMESLLGRHADIVFVASATLMREKKALAPVVIHAPHGVDVAHFAPARQAPPRPIDLPEHGPIIGYFGSVADWIDLGLIQQLAERRPDWQFVLIGPISVAAERLPTAPNVRLLGRRPYEDLPTYGRHFDVAILPYRPTQQVLRANPIKLREYIAMEKPIVALPTPDILEFRDVVRTASTVDEWEAAVTDVLAEPDGRVRQERQRELAVGMSWDARLQAVHDEVMSRLDPIR